MALADLRKNSEQFYFIWPPKRCNFINHFLYQKEATSCVNIEYVQCVQSCVPNFFLMLNRNHSSERPIITNVNIELYKCLINKSDFRNCN